MKTAPLTASDRNKIISELMSVERSSLSPAERLALDLHNTNRALTTSMGTKGGYKDPWANRSEGMKCATCMWYAEKASASGLPLPEGVKERGRCRRHAPAMNGYPVVFGNDWCGDHKLA